MMGVRDFKLWDDNLRKQMKLVNNIHLLLVGLREYMNATLVSYSPGLMYHHNKRADHNATITY